MPLDLQKLRNANYTDKDIVDNFGSQLGVDVEGLRAEYAPKYGKDTDTILAENFAAQYDTLAAKKAAPAEAKKATKPKEYDHGAIPVVSQDAPAEKPWVLDADRMINSASGLSNPTSAIARIEDIGAQRNKAIEASKETLKEKGFRAASEEVAAAEAKGEANRKKAQDGVDRVKADQDRAKRREGRPGVGRQIINDTRRGIDNLSNIGTALVALGDDALGLDELSKQGLREYVAESNRIAAENPAVIGSFDKIESASDFGRYATEAVFENLAMFIPSLVTGGIGASVARKGAEKLVAGMVAKEAARLGSKEAAEKSVAGFVAKQVTKGATAGALPAGVGMEAGNIYGDIYKETGKQEAGVAAAFGLAAGALEIVEPVLALRKALGPVADDVAQSIFKRYGPEVGKQVIAEGGTEFAQTLIESGAISYVDGREWLSEENLHHAVDAMLKGGIAGGVIGAGSQVVADARTPSAAAGGLTPAPTAPSPQAGPVPSAESMQAAADEAARKSQEFAALADEAQALGDTELAAHYESQSQAAAAAAKQSLGALQTEHTGLAGIVNRTGINLIDTGIADQGTVDAARQDAINDPIGQSGNAALPLSADELANGKLDASNRAALGLDQLRDDEELQPVIAQEGNIAHGEGPISPDLSIQPEAAPVNTAPAAAASRTDGTDDVVGESGLSIVHGSGRADLTPDAIQIVRTDGQKQGKKGRTYGGFYGTSQEDAAQAEGYASMMGGTPTTYDVKIKPGTKVLNKTGDVTRLSAAYINELVGQGYGMVVGTDPRGRTEYVVIDKEAIAGMGARQTVNASAPATPAPATTPATTPAAAFNVAQPITNFESTDIQQIRRRMAYLRGVIQASSNETAKADLKAEMKALTAEINRRTTSPADPATVSPETVTAPATAEAGPAAEKGKALTEDSVAAHRLETAKEEILRDIADGTLPDSVRSWSDLQDHVDANMYLNDADRKDRMIGPLGNANGWGGSEFAGFTSKMVKAIDLWLANGRIGKPVFNPDSSLASVQPVAGKPAAAERVNALGKDNADTIEVDGSLSPEQPAAAPKTGASPTGLSYPNRKLGFEVARTEDGGEPSAWANIALANLQPDDKVTVNGVTMTVKSIGAKAVTFTKPDGKTTRFDVDTPRMEQLVRDVAGLLGASHHSSHGRDWVSVLSRDPTFGRTGGVINLQDRGTEATASVDAMNLAARHARLDRAIDQLSDAEVHALYRKMGLAGELLNVDKKREALKQEHPDDTEAAMKAKPEAAKPEVSDNTVFTEDAAEKAREVLRQALRGTQLNTGLDPKVLQAALTLSGYHVERGARTFAAYSQAMIKDLGDEVRPYLKSFYMALKYDPKAAGIAEGMSSEAEVNAEPRTEDRRQSDEAVAVDRRSGPRRVDDMTPDEMRQALLINPLTDLPNKRAFEEDADLGWPHVAAMDIDGFGFLNDIWGHDPVDAILKQIGGMMSEFSTDAVRLYHRSGDEFAARSNDKEALQLVLKSLQDHLEASTFKVPGVDKEGNPLTLIKHGIGVTFGISTDYQRADNEANADKERRLASGDRSAKGTNPGGMVEVDSRGIQTNIGDRGISRQETERLRNRGSEGGLDPEQEAANRQEDIRQQRSQRMKAMLAERAKLKPTDELLTAVAKLGGFNRESAKSEGIDPAYFNERRAGLKPVFPKTGGKGFDAMAETLAAEGYPVQDDQGRYSANVLLDLVTSSLSGKPVYTPAGHEAVMAAEDIQRALEEGDAAALPPSEHVELTQARSVVAVGFIDVVRAGFDGTIVGRLVGDDASAADIHALFAGLINGDSGYVQQYQDAARAVEENAANLAGRPVDSGAAPEEDLPGFDEGQAADDLTDDEVARHLNGESLESIRVSRQADDFSLSTQTEEDLREKEAREQDADSAEEADRQRQIDATSDNFTLSTGTGTAGEQVRPAVRGGGRDMFASPAPVQITDAGDSLHWNRKNPWRSGGLKWDDVADKNVTLRMSMAVKSKIWAKPDWEEYLAEVPDNMREAVTLAARMVKQVYDSIATKPRTEAGVKDYIESVTKAREAAEAFLKDTDAVREFALAMAAKAQARLASRVSILDVIGSTSQTDKKKSQPLFAAMFPESIGQRRFAESEEGMARAVGRKAVAAMQFDIPDVVKAMKDISDNGWPSKREAWQVRGYTVVERDGVFVLRHKPGGSRFTRDISEHGSEAEAIEAARALVARPQSETEPRPEAIALDRLTRTGPPRRQAGEDVTPQDLIDVFGFRGINFGNYVPNDERQAHVNHAFDSMLDLAEALDLPPAAMSLGGMLGLAFGAQGNGGKNGAHFVPGVNEINLTRKSGAGALAHEWAHAVDHYFGVLGGLATAKEPFASWLHMFRRTGESSIRPEVKSAFESIVNAMQKSKETIGDARNRIESYRVTSKQNLDAHIARYALDDKVTGNADASAALEQIKNGEPGEYVEKPRRPRQRRAEATNANVLAVAQAAGLDNVDLELLAQAARSYSFAMKEAVDEANLRTVHTEFYRDSKTADRDDKRDYWATNHEMFARAFEAYVLDKLASKEARNDYLVAASTAEGAVAERTLKVYPIGADRKAINDGFDALFGTVKHKQEDGKTLLYSRNAWYYSPLTRAVEGLKQETAPAQQWIATIAKQAGVKVDELEATGLTDWLQMKSGKVTKSEILSFLGDNGVQVQEVTRTTPGGAAADAAVIASKHGYSVEEDYGDVVFVNANDEPVDFDDLPQAMRDELGRSSSGLSKYDKYTLPGGKDYRELLITLPNSVSEQIADLQRRRAAIEEPYQRRGEDLPESVMPEWRKINSKMRELQDKRSDDYSSSHWDEKNVLAHVRFDERTDADGKRVLFINEIQSDWGQEGKKKGFAPKDPSAPTDDEVRAFFELKNGADPADYRAEMVELLAGRRVPDGRPMPRAPFVTKTDAWVSLAIKRMIRHAAENGFDRVAFINGQQAADLYDLGKQVDRIAIGKFSGGYQVVGRKNGEVVVDKVATDESGLEALVGKDIATKHIETGQSTFEGADLQVGGVGMKAFYDKIVPKVAGDVIKKLGGGKLRPIALGNREELRERAEAARAEGLNDGAAEIERDAADALGEQLGFDITPAMRDAALAGLPLFAKQSSSSGSAAEVVKGVIAPVLAKWKNGPRIEVVQSVSDLPGGSAPHDVEGAYAGNGVVYLVADNLPTEERILEVLSHEAVGHAAMESMLGADLMAELTKEIGAWERRGSAFFVKLGKDVDASQPDLPADRRAKEIVALMAERGLHKQGSLWKRVTGAIRAWLRDLGFTGKWLDSLTDADMFKMLADAERYLEDGRSQSGKRNAEAALAYSRRGNFGTAQSFAEAVDRALRIPGQIDKALEVGRTPDVLKAVGAPDLQVVVSKDVLLKASNGVKHDVSVEALKRLPELLADPVMVFDSKTESGALVVLTEVNDKSGRPVVVALHLNRTEKRFVANKVASIYGKDGADKFVANQVGNGRLLYKHAQKSLDWLQSIGLQLPKEGANQGHESKVLTDADIFNGEGTSGNPASRGAKEAISPDAGGDRGPTARVAEGLGRNEDAVPSGEVTPGKPLFSRASPSVVGDTYKLPPVRTWITRIFDRFDRIKQVQKAVKEQGGQIDLLSDVYGQEEAYHSRAASAIDRFRRHRMGAIFKRIARAGVSLEDVGLYLYAQHAAERNAQIASINPGMPDGGSGMTNKEAADLLADFRQQGNANKLDTFARELRDITADTRQILRASGLESDDAIDAWEKAYQFYVPLSGKDEANNANTVIVGRGFDVRGGQKRAMGRKDKAKHIIEQIIVQHEQAVIRAEKNAVGKRLLQFVKNNPDDNLWEVNPTDRRRYVAADGQVDYRNQPMRTDRNVVAVRINGQDTFILLADESMADAIHNVGTEDVGFVLRALGAVSRFTSKMFTAFSPAFIAVNAIRDFMTAMLHGYQVGGVDYSMAIAKNIPRAVAELVRDAREGNGQLVKLYEQSGGRTGMVYMIKDFEEKHNEVMRQMAALQGVSLKEIQQAFAAGAKEGFKAIGRKARYNKFTGVFDAFVEAVETVNGIVENTTRLAAFKAAMDAGKPAREAGSIAKNLTVNFNRKGELAPHFGSLYIFFNASVQGTARMGEALKDRRLQVVAAGMFMASALIAALQMDDDDDEDGRADFEQIPAWQRSRNLIIRGDGGDYYKIPLPLGWNVFHMLGTEAAVMLKSKSKEAYGSGAWNMLKQTIQAFNPVGDLTPSVAAPFIQILLNESAFGGMIYADYKDDLPDSQQFFDSTEGSTYERLTTWANDATGGNEFRAGLVDINPEKLEHVTEFFGGGALRFLTDTVDAVSAAVDGGPAQPADKLPIVRAFYGKLRDEYQTSRYYENKDKVSAVERELKGLQESGRYDEAAKLMAEKPWVFGLSAMADGMDKQSKSIRELERLIRADDSLSDGERRARLQELRVLKGQAMKPFNAAYEESVRK